MQSQRAVGDGRAAGEGIGRRAAQRQGAGAAFFQFAGAADDAGDDGREINGFDDARAGPEADGSADGHRSIGETQLAAQRDGPCENADDGIESHFRRRIDDDCGDRRAKAGDAAGGASGIERGDAGVGGSAEHELAGAVLCQAAAAADADHGESRSGGDIRGEQQAGIVHTAEAAEGGVRGLEHAEGLSLRQGDGEIHGGEAAGVVPDEAGIQGERAAAERVAAALDADGIEGGAGGVVVGVHLVRSDGGEA